MCINGGLVKFVKTIMGYQLGTFNGSSYLKVIESGRIRLYGYVRHACVYVHLTKKNEILNCKIIVFTIIIVLYHY